MFSDFPKDTELNSYCGEQGRGPLKGTTTGLKSLLVALLPRVNPLAGAKSPNGPLQTDQAEDTSQVQRYTEEEASIL